MAPRFTQTITANSSNGNLGALNTGNSNGFRTYTNGTADVYMNGTVDLGKSIQANAYTLTSALNQ